MFIHFTHWSIVHPWRAWAVLHGHGVCKGHVWSRWCSRSGPTRRQLVLSSSAPGEASTPQGAHPTQSCWSQLCLLIFLSFFLCPWSVDILSSHSWVRKRCSSFLTALSFLFLHKRQSSLFSSTICLAAERTHLISRRTHSSSTQDLNDAGAADDLIGSINNSGEELHGNSQPATVWSFKTFYSWCSVSMMLLCWKNRERRATWTAANWFYSYSVPWVFHRSSKRLCLSVSLSLCFSDILLCWSLNHLSGIQNVR